MPLIHAFSSRTSPALSPEPATPTTGRVFVDRAKTDYINARIKAYHIQLRHLLVLPDPNSSNTVWSLSNSDIVQNSFAYPADQEATRIAQLNFTPVCLVSGCGYIAAGGPNSDLAIRLAVPTATWTLITSLGTSINNSIEIAPSLLHTHPLVYVSNNDRKIVISSLINPDPASYNRVHQLVTEEELVFDTPINHSSVSPDGTKMVAVGDTPEIHLHEISRSDGKHRKIETLRAGRDAAFSTSWSRNSVQFAVASQDRMVSVWDIRKMSKRVATLHTSQPASMGAARVVSFSKEGVHDLMAFSEQMSYVHIVDARTFEHVDKICVDRKDGRDQSRMTFMSDDETRNNGDFGSSDNIPASSSSSFIPSSEWTPSRLSRQQPSSMRRSRSRGGGSNGGSGGGGSGVIRNRAMAISRAHNSSSASTSANNDPRCPENSSSEAASSLATSSDNNTYRRNLFRLQREEREQEAEASEQPIGSRSNEEQAESALWRILNDDIMEGGNSARDSLRQAQQEFEFYHANGGGGLNMLMRQWSNQGEAWHLRRVADVIENLPSSDLYDGNSNSMRNNIGFGIRDFSAPVNYAHISGGGNTRNRSNNYTNFYHNHHATFGDGELVGLAWGPRAETLVIGTESSLIRYSIDGMSRRSFPVGTLI